MIVLIDSITETVEHEIKKQEDGFRGTLLEPLATSLVQSVISSVVQGISGRGVRRDNQKLLVLLHPLSNIEITNYFNYELRISVDVSRNNSPRIKDGEYVLNLDDKNSKETHWVSLFINKNTAAYFGFFGI